MRKLEEGVLVPGFGARRHQVLFFRCSAVQKAPREKGKSMSTDQQLIVRMLGNHPMT